jgi:hypothetical protein
VRRPTRSLECGNLALTASTHISSEKNRGNMPVRVIQHTLILALKACPQHTDRLRKDNHNESFAPRVYNTSPRRSSSSCTGGKYTPSMVTPLPLPPVEARGPPRPLDVNGALSTSIPHAVVCWRALGPRTPRAALRRRRDRTGCRSGPVCDTCVGWGGGGGAHDVCSMRDAAQLRVAPGTMLHNARSGFSNPAPCCRSRGAHTPA